MSNWAVLKAAGAVALSNQIEIFLYTWRAFLRNTPSCPTTQAFILQKCQCCGLSETLSYRSNTSLSCSFVLFLHLNLKLFKSLVTRLILASLGKDNFCCGFFCARFLELEVQLIKPVGGSSVKKKTKTVLSISTYLMLLSKQGLSDLQQPHKEVLGN